MIGPIKFFKHFTQRKEITMSAATLNNVALNVIGQYHVAGKHLAHAYRNGVERLIDATNTRYANFVENRSVPLVNNEIKSNLIQAQQLLASFMVKGVQTSAERAVQAMDAIALRAGNGVHAVSGAAAKVETAFDVSSETVAKLRTLNLPAAHIALNLAQKVAQGAKAVQARVSVDAEGEQAPAVNAKPARRAARKA